MSQALNHKSSVSHFLPSPFTIAVLLTFLTIVMVLLIQPEKPQEATRYEISMNGTTKIVSEAEYNELAEKFEIETAQTRPQPKEKSSVLDIIKYWEKGFWELLQFAMQMVLILILGHALALTKLASRIIHGIVKYCRDTPSSAAIVTFSAIVVGLINWGLGLVFGAILARKVAEQASQNQIKINYPLIAAAGYSGLMVWHGGLSGSAPLTVALPDHFLSSKIGQIPAEFTIFSSMNITVSLLLLFLVPLVMFFLARKQKSNTLLNLNLTPPSESGAGMKGAEKLDHARWLAYLFATMILLFGIYKAINTEGATFWSFLTLNYVNFMLFGLGIALHGNFTRFIKAIDKAIGGAAGIIIQFPIYAGIMGIVKYSGLINSFADFFVSISTTETLPLFTFLSAGIVNVFVPSGGGQWAVQGPIVVQSAIDLGVLVPKNIMALAYGDQLTNMIQPFWALPLLGITGLKASQILPWSFITMLVGIVIFLSCLLIF